MHVGSHADVVRQIPSVMVGIFVDNDLIRIPEPIVAVADIVRSNAKVKAAEPETRWAAASKMPDVATTKATGKVTMLPRMVDVVVGIIAAGVMAHPLIVGVDVGSVRMTTFVTEIRMVGCRTRIGAGRSWAVRGDVTPTNAMRRTLRRGWLAVRQNGCE